MPKHYYAEEAAQIILTNNSDKSIGEEEEIDISDEAEDIVLEERNSETEESDTSDSFSSLRFTSENGQIWSGTSRRQDLRGRYTRSNILRETARRIRDSFDSPVEVFSCFCYK